MILSNLTPLCLPYHPRPQAQAQQQSASVFRFKEVGPTPVALVPSVPAETQHRIAIENLTADDVRNLSIATINALIPYNRKVVAQAIVDAGRRRRGELETPAASLKPIARFVKLAGERRRGRALNEEEDAFMVEFPASVGAS
jgi:hypothetical protein